MPQTEKPPRSRKGYVMVELSTEDRATLEEIARRLGDQYGTEIGMAGAVRTAIRAYRKNPDKFLRLLLTLS